MKKLSQYTDWVLGGCMAACLVTMSCLVFSNVVLRYVFDSSITWSEEMSRYLFVFMIFFGTTRALSKGLHLKVDIFLQLLPSKGLRTLLQLGSSGLMLYALYLLIDGSWELIQINLNTVGPATGMPLWWLYTGGLLMGVAMSVITLLGVVQLLRNQQATKEQG